MKTACLWIAIIMSVFFVGLCRAEEKAAPEKKGVMPKKVQVDSNFDGKIDRIEQYDANGQIVKVESDTNGDGVIDEWVAYEGGKPVKSEKDTNGDGKPDVWVDY